MTSRVEAKLNYPTEQTEDQVEHRTGYQGAQQETNLEASDKHMVAFTSKIKDLDDQKTVKARTVFAMRDDLGDHRLQDRREALNLYTQAFNTLEFNGKEKERLHAAQDVAQTIFKPMHEHILGTDQLQAEYNVDPEIVRRMKEAGIHHVERVNIGEDGKVDFVFEANEKFAKELVEHTGGEARILEARSKNLAEYDPRAAETVLLDYQARFTDTLMSSRENPKAAEKLWEIFNEAYNYSRTEKTGEAVEPRNITQEDFQQIAEMTEDRQRFEIERMVQATWKESLHTLGEMCQNKDPDYRSANEACRVMEELHHKAIAMTIQGDNYETFKLIADNIGDSRDEFIAALKDNTGFVNTDYQQGSLPDKFTFTDDALAYAQMAGFQLEFIKDDNQNNEVMSAMAYQSAVQLLTELNHDIHVYQAIEDIVPDLSEEHRRMHQKAQGLDYIMRIKAPEDPQEKEQAAMMEEARLEAIQEDIETAEAQEATTF